MSVVTGGEPPPPDAAPVMDEVTVTEFELLDHADYDLLNLDK